MLELLELWHLIYPRLLAKFGMLVFFANLSLMGFPVRYLSLFLLFSVIDGFKRFLMGSLHKNIQLMQELLRAPSLVLNFSYYTLTTFLIMSSVILLSMTLLSMLLILLSIPSAIRYLICSNNLNWLLNLNLIYKTLWTGARSSLLISMLGKLNWFCLTNGTMVLLMWKWMGLFLRKNRLLRCWGWPSLQKWIGALTLSLLLKLPPRELEF